MPIIKHIEYIVEKDLETYYYVLNEHNCFEFEKYNAPEILNSNEEYTYIIEEKETEYDTNLQNIFIPNSFDSSLLDLSDYYISFDATSNTNVWVFLNRSINVNIELRWINYEQMFLRIVDDARVYPLSNAVQSPIRLNQTPSGFFWTGKIPCRNNTNIYLGSLILKIGIGEFRNTMYLYVIFDGKRCF